MASLRFEERLEISAPAERVWRYLIDPERIVVCLPGASLDLIQDERTFSGKVRVKVGAVSMGYRGTVEFTELDHEARRVRMVGKGRESGGSGSATLAMVSTVAEAPGGAAVVVQADVKLSGKIVRFGRGMIEGVAQEIFQEFGARLEERMAEESGPLSEVQTEAASIDGPPGRDAATEPEPAVRLLPLLWRAFKSWLRRGGRRRGAGR